MFNLLRIAVIAAVFGGILQADVYTYAYTGAPFKIDCQTFVPCGPISGVGNLTGYATFSQPIGPNQTVDQYSDTLIDWALYGGLYGTQYPNRSYLSLTTNSFGGIVSWYLEMDAAFGDFPVAYVAQNTSSSSGGDYSLSGVWIDQFYFESYSTSTAGTWVAEFPEPAQTPLKSILLLAVVASVICILKRKALQP
jgi:hypothetical protein